MENKRILVIGGTGYIGKEISYELLKRGYTVTIMSRSLSKEFNVLKGNVLDKEFLFKNIKDFDCIIYLAAVIKSFFKSKYKENITGLNNVLDTMKKNNVKKIIYFSTQNVNIDNTGYYGNSKKESEKLLKNSGIEHMIIRPNYVYGIDKNNYFYRLIKIIKKLKICPIIGNGNYKFQPVNKKDLARITVDSLRYFKNKEIIEISGKDTLSINNIIEFIGKEGNYKFFKIHLPISILKIFKKIIPFDVDGFNEDRIIPKNPFSFAHNIRDDLRQIMKL